MQFLKKLYLPGGENESGGNIKKEQNETEDAKNKQQKEKDEDDKKHSKLRDALQQWSNDDARDIEEDDSSPLRSGL